MLLLTRVPKLKGMYASWDVPAMGAVAAVRVAGKSPDEFKVVKENLGNEVALAMAKKRLHFWNWFPKTS